MYPNILSRGGSFFFHNTNTKNKPRQQIRETSFMWNENTFTGWQNSVIGGQEVIYLLWRWTHSEIQTIYTLHCSSKISPFFSAVYQRRIHYFSCLPYTKTIMTEVQNASRSKCSMVPYSKDNSETVLLDSVIFYNVHIFFYWIKQLRSLSGTAQQNI